jgi:hypothetical protein
MASDERSRPQARTDGVVVVDLPDEVLVYDEARHRAHCLSPTAALVWKQCDGRTTVAALGRRLAAHPGGRSLDRATVELALAELARARLLVEPAVRRADGSRLTRREVLRRAGLAAAAAVPLVASVTVPAVSSAASCLPFGAACTSGSECCSGCCTGICFPCV